MDKMHSKAFICFFLYLILQLKKIDGNSIKIQPFSFPSDSAIGKRASVTCTPLTGEKMEFKWLKNGKEIGNGRHNIHIATLPLISSLIIDPLKSDDNGNYTCVVNSRGMSGSFTTSLEVMGEATNSAFASISNQATLFPNGSFYIENISKEDEGMYQCNVSNGIGNSLIKTIMIKVIVGAFLTIQPFSFPSNSAIGKRVSVTCTPLEGEKMEFKWLRNGKELTSGSHNVNILSYPLLSNLIIDPLTSENSGNYTCVVSSRGLTGSFTTKLDVLVPPSWIVSPSDTDVSSGDSLMLNCKGSGKPEPTTTWFKTQGENSDFFLLSESNQVRINSNGSLHIESVVKEDEGMYKCNISNGIGKSLIKTIMVKVIGMQKSILRILIFHD
ncbi:UNVERIFIED_CONTAM: Down syndrome cell adhesion molecule-like protein [Trichonephila clavipes]